MAEAEAFYSHTHLVDLFEHKWHYIHDHDLDLDRPDPNDPEHRLSWSVAQIVGEMWLTKLHSQFPDYRFRVYVTRLDDPIVRFHRVRPNERFWLEDTDIGVSDGLPEVVILDSSAAHS